MKTTLLAFILLSTPLLAIQGRKITASGGSPIPTTFGTGGQSLILSEIKSSDKNLLLFATVAGAACTFGNSSVTPPVTITAGNANEFHIPANAPLVLLNAGSAKNIYCRSTTGSTLTSGDLAVHTY